MEQKNEVNETITKLLDMNGTNNKEYNSLKATLSDDEQKLLKKLQRVK